MRKMGDAHLEIIGTPKGATIRIEGDRTDVIFFVDAADCFHFGVSPCASASHADAMHDFRTRV